MKFEQDIIYLNSKQTIHDDNFNYYDYIVKQLDTFTIKDFNNKTFTFIGFESDAEQEYFNIHLLDIEKFKEVNLSLDIDNILDQCTIYLGDLGDNVITLSNNELNKLSTYLTEIFERDMSIYIKKLRNSESVSIYSELIETLEFNRKCFDLILSNPNHFLSTTTQDMIETQIRMIDLDIKKYKG